MHDQLQPFVLERARACYHLGLRSDGSIPQEDAALVLFSFSCELSLKGLGADAARLKRMERHNLLSLFDVLPDGRGAWLSDRYAQTEAGTLREDLSRCATTFVDARYWHEEGRAMFASGTMRRLARFMTEASDEAVAARPGRQFIVSEVHHPKSH